MLMSSFVVFISLLLGYSGRFVMHQLIDWVKMNWRLARQQPSAHEEATNEKTDEKVAEEAESTIVTLLEPDLLECPICCEPLKIPIFQCRNGHLACSPCCERIKNLCPSCQLPIGYNNRCRAMEKITEAFRVTCPNTKYGCKENVTYDNRSSHEKQCVFAPCSCPLRGCYYIGIHKDLKKHVTAKHKEGLIRFVCETPLGIEFSLSEKITVFREEKDEELIVVQSFKGSHGMFVSVSSIAPLATKTGRFSCSLVLRTSKKTLEQRFKVKRIQKVSSEQPEDNFVLVPSYMMRKGFTMKICITRGEVHSSERA